MWEEQIDQTRLNAMHFDSSSDTIKLKREFNFQITKAELINWIILIMHFMFTCIIGKAWNMRVRETRKEIQGDH